MRSILSLDVGTVVFAPGVSGVGTLVLSKIPVFNPVRLLAVTNVTQGVMIYLAEGGNANGGQFTFITGTGATLTLMFDTHLHNAGDELRCYYDAGTILDVQPTGKNGVGKRFEQWTQSPQTTLTSDYGPGPLPGTRSNLVSWNMTPDNTGLSTNVDVFGRSDGARFIYSFYAKDNGTVQSMQVELYASSPGYGFISAAPYTAPVTPGDGQWHRYSVELTCNIFNATFLVCQTRGAPTITTTLELACADMRQTFDGTPETYAEPSGTALITLLPMFATSVAAWGDSLTAGAGGFEFRTELSSLLNGSTVYNGGVGGETSTQVKTRMLAGTQYNVYGTVLIWAGRNNFSSYATVLSDIDAMVAAMPHARFLVLGVTNNTSEAMGSLNHLQISYINAQLATKYGRKFVDIRTRWCQGSSTDIPNVNYMYDATHPNAVGQGMVALAVYTAMIRNGYVPGEAQPAPVLAQGVSGTGFNRPADTNAYAIGDAVANSTTAADITPLVIPIQENQRLRRVRLVTGQSATGTFRLHVFGAPPTAGGGDNAAIALTGAGIYLGAVDIVLTQLADGAAGNATLTLVGRMPSYGALYVLIEARSVYNPASAQSFVVYGETDP